MSVSVNIRSGNNGSVMPEPEPSFRRMRRSIKSIIFEDEGEELLSRIAADRPPVIGGRAEQRQHQPSFWSLGTRLYLGTFRGTLSVRYHTGTVLSTDMYRKLNFWISGNHDTFFIIWRKGLLIF